MVFDESKITEEESKEVGIVSQPDTLNGSAEQNKAAFDALPNLIITRLNLLIDALKASVAATELGATPFEGVEGSTVQQQITDVQGNLTALKEQAGAANIGVMPFEGVQATTVQGALQALQGNLLAFIALLQSQQGAAKVGATPFEGVVGDTVQQQITNVQGNLLALKEDQDNLQTFISLLQSQAGAAKVGTTPFDGMPATDVQGALQVLQQHIDDIQAGIIPIGSITWDMLTQSVKEEIDGKLSLSGGKMRGMIDMNGQRVIGLSQPTDETDAARILDVQKMIGNVTAAQVGAFAKEQTLTAATAALVGLGADATPDQMFAKLKGLLDAAGNHADTKAQIEVKSYIGTGTYGESNPCSLTFSFVPDYALVLVSKQATNQIYPIALRYDNMPYMVSSILTTSYGIRGSGFCIGDAVGGYGKKSPDGRTIYWYSNSASSQLNHSGDEYFFVGIGK